jgi:hypothetical protein
MFCSYAAARRRADGIPGVEQARPVQETVAADRRNNPAGAGLSRAISAHTKDATPVRKSWNGCVAWAGEPSAGGIVV